MGISHRHLPRSEGHLIRNLRASEATAILSSAIVVFLRVVGSKSNDARMTRWPLSFTASRCYTNSGDMTALPRRGVIESGFPTPARPWR